MPKLDVKPPLRFSKDKPKRVEVDLHGLHPQDDELYLVIVDAIRRAYETSAVELTIIHGHGLDRMNSVNAFVNSNTGYLGRTVRGMLWNNPELRPWMLAKFDCSDIGSTTVRIRNRKSTTE